MMRLLCNGVVLDLPSSSKITFDKKNPLFAFDNMSCERTAEFSLPSTPKNDSVLSLARIPAYSGEGMRRKFSAQLQCGTIVKDGYLYVSKFSKGSYSCIFVCGELVKLQAIKDAGNIAEYMYFSDWEKCNDYVQSGNNFRQITYSREKGFCSPSIFVKYMADTIASHFGVSLSMPTSLASLVIVPNIPRSLEETSTKITRKYLADPTTSSYPVVNSQTIAESKIGVYFSSDTTSGRAIYTTSDAVTYIGLVDETKTNTNLTISFDVRTKDEIHIGYFNESGYFTFLGGYSFVLKNGSVVRTGDPLGGRSVDIPQGTSFVLVHEDELIEEGSQWKLTKDLEVDVTFKGKDDACAENDICRMQDCLPECTFVDILKTIAALSGKSLNYENDSITFDDLEFKSWGIVDITGKVTEVSELTRSFCDYAQHNIVKFDSSSNVAESAKLSVEYTIDNDTIEEENELQTIPFSEGGVTHDAIFDNLFYDDNENEDADNDGLASNGGGGRLLHLTLPKNENLQTLCDSSTTIDVKVSMTMLEAERLAPKTRILLDGTLYVWVESKWSDGKMELTLSKI